MFNESQTKLTPCTETHRDYMILKKQRNTDCEPQKRFGVGFNLMLWSIKHTHAQNSLNICVTKVFDDLQWNIAVVRSWLGTVGAKLHQNSLANDLKTHIWHNITYLWPCRLHELVHLSVKKKSLFHFKNLSTNQSAGLLAIATPPLFSPWRSWDYFHLKRACCAAVECQAFHKRQPYLVRP